MSQPHESEMSSYRNSMGKKQPKNNPHKKKQKKVFASVLALDIVD
jgi:hypothetical protein